MNIVRKNCQVYTFNFPEPSSLREVLFAPQTVVRQDLTVTERMQRWLIDNGSFYDRACKGFKLHLPDSRHPKPSFTLDQDTLCQAFNAQLLAESMVGHSFSTLTTSMVLRSIELFSQSTRNSLNFSALSPKTKAIMNYLIIPAVFAFTYCLGYAWKDVILFAFVPLLLEKVLSFKSSNYFKQIHTLSSTKDFVLRDFIVKNIQASIIRAIPTILLLLFIPRAALQPTPAWVRVCKVGPRNYNPSEFQRASSSLGDLLLEPILLMLGKMTFDLTYILILKTLSPNADLRDPMGWMFSMLKPQATSTVPSQTKTHSTLSTKKSTFNQQAVSSKKKTIANQTSLPNFSNLELELSEPKAHIPESQESQYYQKSKKNKINTPDKEDNPQPATKKTTIAKVEELQTEINIEVGGWIRSFQKIEDSSFKKQTWAVIIADSVEKQKLTKYERLLANGTIGGGIRQLKGWGDRYEIGTTMDSRLIGKMYDTGVYHSLQSFMRLEDALQVSQELEQNGIPDNVALIIFSAKAKNHNDIARVANKL